jgi:hypothetical protein
MDTGRYIDVEVEAAPDLEEGVERRFKAIDASRIVSRVVLSGEELAGTFRLRAASIDGAPNDEPVYATRVEDSSEGVALLIHGGEGGLWLFDEAGRQVKREGCLLLAPATVAT